MAAGGPAAGSGSFAGLLRLDVEPYGEVGLEAVGCGLGGGADLIEVHAGAVALVGDCGCGEAVG